MLPTTAALGMFPTKAPPGLSSAILAQVSEVASTLGIVALEPWQNRLVEALLTGKDALVVSPSSSKTRAAYQICAQILSQPTVVVGARPAIRREQHDRLLMRRMRAVLVDSSIQGEERIQAIKTVSQGGPMVLQTTPDSLRRKDLLQALAKSGVARVVIEEAHGIAGSGHEQRISYRSLRERLQQLGNPPVLAEVPVAVQTVRAEVSAALALRTPAVVTTPAIREYVTLVAEPTSARDRLQSLQRQLSELRRPGLVLCPSPADVELVFERLSELRVPAHRFHEAMSAGTRGAELLNFMVPGRRTVMVATSAFWRTNGVRQPNEGEEEGAPSRLGLTLEKRDLRFVVHLLPPTSLEQYVREVELLARDGNPGKAILLFSSAPDDGSISDTAQPHSAGLTALGKALAAHAGDKEVFQDALAGEAHLDLETVAALVAILEEAILVSEQGGWIRPLVDGRELQARIRELAALLDGQQERARERSLAVQSYATSSECRRVLIARYFGDHEEACGRCDNCMRGRARSSSQLEPGDKGVSPPQPSPAGTPS